MTSLEKNKIQKTQIHWTETRPYYDDLPRDITGVIYVPVDLPVFCEGQFLLSIVRYSFKTLIFLETVA